VNPRLRRAVVLGLSGAAAAALLAARRVRRLRLAPVLIQGDSMRPTLVPGQRVAVAPLSGPPPRGALVVLRRPASPSQAGREPLEVVKRVAALPGERVRLAGSETTLAADEYLVLGDNPARSTDSRSFGPVHSEDFTGIVRCAYWPPRRLTRHG
jgi:signal peptidase I